MKTARQIRAPFIPEIHMVGGGAGADAIGELFRACGWLVIYEPSDKRFTVPVGKNSRTRRKRAKL
jgi:Ethanolamine utilization protein EutJ (predicted chaperonin)